MKKEIKRLKEKLKQIKEICLTNAKIWNETEHDPVEEFKLMAKIIDEKWKNEHYNLMASRQPRC